MKDENHSRDHEKETNLEYARASHQFRVVMGFKLGCVTVFASLVLISVTLLVMPSLSEADKNLAVVEHYIGWGLLVIAAFIFYGTIEASRPIRSLPPNWAEEPGEKKK